MPGEDWRYQPEKDTLTIYPGILASYPNFAFNVVATGIGNFAPALAQMRSAKDRGNVVMRRGIRRAHPDLWTYFHDYTRYIEENEPVAAGILDMSRYENL